MAEKKIIQEIRQKIADAVHEVINEFNSVVGKKLKKSTDSHAKKLSEKFAKTVKKLDKKGKKGTTAKKGKAPKKAKKRPVSTIQLNKNITNSSPAAAKAPAKKAGSKASKSKSRSQKDE